MDEIKRRPPTSYKTNDQSTSTRMMRWCKYYKGWWSEFLLPWLWTLFLPSISTQISKRMPVLNFSGNFDFRNDQDVEDWWNIKGKMLKKLKTSKNLCIKRGLTGNNPLRITIGSDGIIQWPFHCESWMPEEYSMLLQTSKYFQNTKVMPLWKFAFNFSSRHLVFLWRVNIETNCWPGSNLELYSY